MQTSTRAPRVSLREFFPHSHIVGSPDIRISSCCDDPRRCRPGDLYAAVQTAGGDRPAALDEALRRGAQAVLADRLHPLNVPVCVG